MGWLDLSYNGPVYLFANSKAWSDEKKRLESRIAELEDELDEEQNNSELFAEKARKQGLQVKHDKKRVLLWGGGRG